MHRKKYLILLVMFTFIFQGCANMPISGSGEQNQILDDGSIVDDPTNNNIDVPTDPSNPVITPTPSIPSTPTPSPPVGPTPEPTPIPNPPTPVTPNPPSLSPSYFGSESVVFESDNNDGSIGLGFVINVSGDEFVTDNNGIFVEGYHYVASNIPEGLSVELSLVNNTRINVSILGQAIQHEMIDSINNAKIQLLETIFINQQLPIDGSDEIVFSIKFKNMSSIIMYSVMSRQGYLLGGRSGADQWCVQHKPSGFDRGVIKAFISIAEDDEIVDMKSNYLIPNGFPIESVSGEQVALDWDTMLNEGIEASLEDTGVLVHANGNRVAWWSGSNTVGELADHCGHFNDFYSNGSIGDNKEVEGWMHTPYININPVDCTDYARVICVAYDEIL